MNKKGNVAGSLQMALCERLFDQFSEAIAEEMIAAQEVKGPLLTSREFAVEQKRQKLVEEFTQKGKTLANRAADGISVAKAHFAEHFSTREIEEIENELDQATNILLYKLVNKEPFKEATLQRTLKLSDKTMAAFYTVGRDLFKRKNYADALTIFSFLNYTNALVLEYWTAKGRAHEMCQEPTDAIASFVSASALFPHLPEPRARVIEIYLSQGMIDEAKEELAALSSLVSKDPAFQEMWRSYIVKIQSKIGKK